MPGEFFCGIACPCLPSALQRDLWSLDQFEIKKQLYEGKMTRLYLATCKLSGLDVCIKSYVKAKLSPLNRVQVAREITIHSQLRHDNIIQLYATFEDANSVYMVLEIATGGDLFSSVKKANGKCFSDHKSASTILAPFLNAIVYLHGKGIVHRDIKPENILLTSDGVIKIADFGLAIDLNEERPVTRLGTLDYMAPEVLACPDKKLPDENKDKADLVYSAQVDTWAAGVLAFEILTGNAPFGQESRKKTYEHIIHKEPMFPENMSKDAKSFIQAALSKDAAKRPTADQLLNHPWIRQHSQSQGQAVLAVRLSGAGGAAATSQRILQTTSAASGPLVSHHNNHEDETDLLMSYLSASPSGGPLESMHLQKEFALDLSMQSLSNSYFTSQHQHGASASNQTGALTSHSPHVSGRQRVTAAHAPLSPNSQRSKSSVHSTNFAIPSITSEPLSFESLVPLIPSWQSHPGLHVDNADQSTSGSNGSAKAKEPVSSLPPVSSLRKQTSQLTRPSTPMMLREGNKSRLSKQVTISTEGLTVSEPPSPVFKRKGTSLVTRGRTLTTSVSSSSLLAMQGGMSSDRYQGKNNASDNQDQYQQQRVSSEHAQCSNDLIKMGGSLMSLELAALLSPTPKEATLSLALGALLSPMAKEPVKHPQLYRRFLSKTEESSSLAESSRHSQRSMGLVSPAGDKRFASNPRGYSKKLSGLDHQGSSPLLGPRDTIPAMWLNSPRYTPKEGGEGTAPGGYSSSEDVNRSLTMFHSNSQHEGRQPPGSSHRALALRRAAAAAATATDWQDGRLQILRTNSEVSVFPRSQAYVETALLRQKTFHN